MKTFSIVLLLQVACVTTPAAAGPPGAMTIAEWRWFLDETERRYDERASRAIAIFQADAALTAGFMWSGCLKSQTVAELRAWLRTEGAG